MYPPNEKRNEPKIRAHPLPRPTAVELGIAYLPNFIGGSSWELIPYIVFCMALYEIPSHTRAIIVSVTKRMGYILFQAINIKLNTF